MTAAAHALRTCPRCGATETQDLIEQAGYHCRRCAFELAYVEVSPSGGVRRVIGWLRAPGDVVGGRYRVSTVLGKGGYAATYLVEDLRLAGKRHALKEIPEQCYDEHESQLLGRLHHPSIPDITDRLEADGMVYLVLEFGGSQTLESERRSCGGRVPLERVHAWMIQVCDVLAYLHEQTPPILHRDLKPANMLLDDHGRVMLIDFGIAKASAGVEGTRTLARAASHGFSPPEQVLGTGTDARSDVYALGATMYALLTSAVPPPAHKRLTGADLVPPRTLNDAIPAELERLILSCLELRPEHRPQSIDQVRAGLPSGSTSEPASSASGEDDVTVRVLRLEVHAGSSAAETPTAPVPPPTPPRARTAWAPRAATATGVVLALGTAVALLQPWRSGSGNAPHPGRVPDSELSATTSTVVRPLEPPPPAAGVQTDPPQPLPTSPPPDENPPELHSSSPPLDDGTSPPIEREVPIPPQPTPAPRRQTLPRPRQQAASRPRTAASRPPPAVRAAQPAKRSRSAAHPNPPPAWVLIPQPARRTD